MDIPKVSVIIPFYNVENYIRASIESIVNQTLKEIEIIAVNDGSSDGSLNIVEQYSQIHVICQENGGASAARNRGIEIARGKYIYFMDSDDTIELHALEVMYNAMEKENLEQIIMSPDNYMDIDRDELQVIYENEYNEVLTGKKLFAKYVKNIHFCSGPPFRMIKAEVLEHNKLKFYEGIIFEDELFTFKLLMLCNRVKVINMALYHVTFRPDSVTAATDYERRFVSYVTITNCLYEEAHWENSSEEEMKAIYVYFMERFNECNEYYYRLNTELKKRYKEKYRRVFYIAKKCGYYGNIKIRLMCHIPGKYALYYNLIAKK